MTSNASTNPTTGNYRTRADLSSLQHSNTSAHVPSKSSYYESANARHKDSVYDSYHSRVPTATSRYNDYDHYGLNSSGSSAYGYYNGRDKENAYKSKYEPSRLYAEINNNSETFGREKNAPRYQKAYRRTATTNFNNNYDDGLVDASTSASATGYSGRNNLSSTRYGLRKSLGGAYQRSQTQKFFDSEKSSVLRSLNDTNNNNIDPYGSNGDADDSIKSEAMKEREARRKEIQSLIAKYAQIDDVYLRAIDAEPSAAKPTAPTAAITPSMARTSIGGDYTEAGCANGSSSGSSGGLNGKSGDLMSNSGVGYGLSYGYTQQASVSSARSSFMPLSKTQSVSSMSSANRSRIPKTLPAFVRYSSIMSKLFIAIAHLSAYKILIRIFLSAIIPNTFDFHANPIVFVRFFTLVESFFHVNNTVNSC